MQKFSATVPITWFVHMWDVAIKGFFIVVFRVYWFHAIGSIKDKCTLVVVDPIKELEQRFSLAQDIMNITRDL
jgi:hypothetical protein